MVTEKLIEESKGCDNCLCWLKHCNAECCKIIRIKIANADLTHKFLSVKSKEPMDKVRYFALRGVIYNRGILKFPTKECTQVGKEVIYYRKCDYLDNNNHCIIHLTNKPKFCREFTIETATKDMNVFLTPNCLFRYKLMR